MTGPASDPSRTDAAPLPPPVTPDGRTDGERDTGATPSTRRASHLVGGLLLLVAGVLWLLDVADAVDPPWRVILPAALVVVGLAVLVLSLWGGAGELIGVGVVLTVLVIASALLPDQLSARIGDQDHRPATAEELSDRYSHGIGELTIDLRGLGVDDLPDGATVGASVGVGELEVRVPRELTVVVVATAGVGEVSTFDRSNSGFAVEVEETYRVGTGPELRLELSVGIGRIVVAP
jgi:hypothetical protein